VTNPEGPAPADAIAHVFDTLTAARPQHATELATIRSGCEAAANTPAQPPPPVALPPLFDGIPDPPRAGLLDQIEAALRPHRPAVPPFRDPMPSTPLPSSDVVAAFDAGYQNTLSVLRGALQDGTLERMNQAAAEDPPRRVVCNAADRSVSLDGKVRARELPEGIFEFVRLIVEAYPNPITFTEMLERSVVLAGANQSRLKKNIPETLKDLIKAVRGRGSVLTLPKPR
jgi:hypothetical protein